MSSELRRETTNARRRVGLALVALLCGGSMIADANAEQIWKTVAQMSAEDKALFDPATSTPRDSEFPYMPAERYPFEAPYTVEEMGYRAANFPHVARWQGAMLDVFGAITSSGYINQGETIFYMMLEPGVGYEGYLYATKPGDVYGRWMAYDIFPPENEGTQQLWATRRTDREFRTKMDFFVYSPQLRRVRRQPEPRRDQRFADNAQTFDDVIGRDPWEFEWELLGTDVLYETIRFPTTRPTITLNRHSQGFVERATDSLKPMGDDYPHYLADGGVACWVVKATARDDWLPGYSEKTLILWLEKTTFYPLRREKYDKDGALMTVEVRLAEHERPELGTFGYTAFSTVYWNIPNDLISYSFHNPMHVREWTEEQKAMIFTAEFMRRDWLIEPMKGQVLISDPDEYFLRPHLHPEKFPGERNVAVPAQVEARVRAQNEAGHLVFETAGAPGNAAGE
ncbi:MAG TPA: DUF1329 domain-containing protein [Gammaproteobacteria bacterium]|nr:DUF1329 domain-containing protein [Gammaproteobacteria bacterium]